jgi:hypothetical protein
LYYHNEASTAIDKNSFTYFPGAIPMSKHLLGSLKFSGGILSIYCLSLAIVPTASADTNLSNATGFNISNASGVNISNATGFAINNFNSFAPGSAAASRGNGGSAGAGDAGDTIATGDGSGTGDKSNPTFGRNRQANIRSAQALQSRLDAAQAAFDSASARVSQLLASSSTPSTTPDNPKLSAVRFALKPMNSTEAGECGCNNPDVAVKPADNGGAELAARELAAAKEAQAKAAIELADAQAQARQFLASAKAPQVESQNTTFSPLW